jgi:hypothetical protein
MHYNDPSEAVESSNILSQLAIHFDIVEMKEYGGTVLHLLLYEIAHHFLPGDPRRKNGWLSFLKWRIFCCKPASCLRPQSWQCAKTNNDVPDLSASVRGWRPHG